MTNHVHLLASPEREISLPKTLQSVGRRYVRYFNHVYGRTGTLWEGRYKAIDRCGGLSFHLYAPYRDESGTGGDGEPTRRLPLVELPRERTGGNGGLAHPPIACTGAWAKQQLNGWRRIDSFFSRRFPMPMWNRSGRRRNKAWVLGNDRFRAKIEMLSGRRESPLPKGRPCS